MVVVSLIDCSKSMGELGESNNALVAFGRKMHLARMDCLPIACKSLWEPLGKGSVKQKAVREMTERFRFRWHGVYLFKIEVGTLACRRFVLMESYS